MPLTQEQLGDLLGLLGSMSAEPLRQRRDDGLVGVEGQHVTIKDLDKLSALADVEAGAKRHGSIWIGDPDQRRRGVAAVIV